MGHCFFIRKFGTRLIVFFFLFCVAGISSVSAKSRIDSLLTELDKTLEVEKQYTQQKEDYLHKIKLPLDNRSLRDEERYNIYQTLAKEYEAFICDSALLYSEKAFLLAQKLNNKEWINDSKLQLARIQGKVSMFSTAVNILSSIDRKALTEKQLIDYYQIYSDTYIYWLEYQDGHDIQLLMEKRNAYQDSIISVLPVDSYEYAINYGTKCIEHQRYDEAEKLLLPFLSKITPNTRNYSVLTSILAYLYGEKGDLEKQKEFLILSAISDIKAAVKENLSLRFLAISLFDSGDVRRANRYIKGSMDDANFYNARLRNIQISKVLPIIDRAYQLDREMQQSRLRSLSIILSIVSLILLIAIYAVVKQVKKLSRAKKEILIINTRLNQLNENLQEANEQQKETNTSLAEANHIKEQFISSFLEICTEYIDKFDAFKITVNRKIKAGQTADILKITSSSEDSVRELKELYANFDKAFLNIYPKFVEEFNSLLRKEEYYPISKDKSLNQELRIFALIRLGITDSNKMATFLHYSLRTIYNYRSKVKAKALNPDDDFEEKIKQLCSQNF